MNIILYPRVYNKRGAENSHSVLGVTHEGELVNVKLRLDKVTENSPSIKEFSRDDRKAKQACTATKDNGKDRREGVLLFTRCFLDEKDYNNNETNYVAKWATVLCEDKDSNEPIIGFGRLVIPKDFEAYKLLSEKLQVALEQEDEDEVDAIKTEMAKYSSFSFPGIIYSHDRIRTFISSEIEEAKTYVKESIHETFQSGMVGGFAIRLLTKDYKVIPNSYLEVFQKYNPKTKEYITAKQTADMYFDSEHAKTAFKSNEFLIDIIPLKRMNSGKFTTKHYSSKNVYPMVKSLYSTIKGNIKICKVVAKTYNFVNPQNFDETKVLLDRMHSLSEPLGHPMRLSKDGTMSLLLRGETSDSLNTDTEKFYWVGNDPSRISMSRNQRILYLLDKGHMPTSSKGRVNDTVQLIENDLYSNKINESDGSIGQKETPLNQTIQSQEVEREEDSPVIDEVESNSEQEDLSMVTDNESNKDASEDYGVKVELSSDHEQEQSDSSQDSVSPNTIDEENISDESHDEEPHEIYNKEASETVKNEHDCILDVVDSKKSIHSYAMDPVSEEDMVKPHEKSIDSENDEVINSIVTDMKDDDEDHEQGGDDNIQTESTVSQVDFGSLVELEDTLSTNQPGNNEVKSSEEVVDTHPEDSYIQEQDTIEEDENSGKQGEELCSTDNSVEQDQSSITDDKFIEVQEEIEDDYSSKFMESIEQIKKGKKSDVIHDEQDPADILARWKNDSDDKKDVESKPSVGESKEKPQKFEAPGEEGLTGMAAFMKGYLE